MRPVPDQKKRRKQNVSFATGEWEERGEGEGGNTRQAFFRSREFTMEP